MTTIEPFGFRLQELRFPGLMNGNDLTIIEAVTISGTPPKDMPRYMTDVVVQIMNLKGEVIGRSNPPKRIPIPGATLKQALANAPKAIEEAGQQIREEIQKRKIILPDQVAESSPPLRLVNGIKN